MLTGGGGGSGCGFSGPSHDFTSSSAEPMFRQPTCFCGCCNIHHNSAQSGKKTLNGGMSNISSQQSQVLTFPDSKAPLSSFNEGRRINVTSSSATTWEADFQRSGHSGFKSNEIQQQSMSQMSQQHCCFPPIISGGSVEIVKVGEGPPLTWADLQRHGTFSFPDGNEWPTRMHSQRPSSIHQTSQASAQKCPPWKAFTMHESKRKPISEYSNWSQRKKSTQQVHELPHDFMIYKSSPPSATQGTSKPMASESGCFCDQAKLATTTVQTESPIIHQQHHHHHPILMAPHACNQCSCGGQNFSTEPWQAASDSSGGVPLGPISEVQQKKYSLPPASHHSPEQRTSYRTKRIY
ncbi:conserved hypothetical protein [Echinococcus multilocularis]|uniref:Uncharacterized protein n=1 Tax=Echinococcus multilocularis TaxID=6211 RepID=A0A087VX25_ECHMU|nr:conserved hypothetical protein [Echinococcus multilocularis]